MPARQPPSQLQGPVPLLSHAVGFSLPHRTCIHTRSQLRCRSPHTCHTSPLHSPAESGGASPVLSMYPYFDSASSRSKVCASGTRSGTGTPAGPCASMPTTPARSGSGVGSGGEAMGVKARDTL